MSADEVVASDVPPGTCLFRLQDVSFLFFGAVLFLFTGCAHTKKPHEDHTKKHYLTIFTHFSFGRVQRTSFSGYLFSFPFHYGLIWFSMILRDRIIHIPTSLEVSERGNDWAQRSSRAKRAVRVNKWAVKRMSKRTSEWPSTYIWTFDYSGP